MTLSTDENNLIICNHRIGFCNGFCETFPDKFKYLQRLSEGIREADENSTMLKAKWRIKWAGLYK